MLSVAEEVSELIASREERDRTLLFVCPDDPGGPAAADGVVNVDELCILSEW